MSYADWLKSDRMLFAILVICWITFCFSVFGLFVVHTLQGSEAKKADYYTGLALTGNR